MAGSIVGSVASAAIGGGLSYLSSRQQSKAAGKAADINAAYLGEALDLQRENFNYLKGIQQPYLEFGNAGLDAYANALGFRRDETRATGPDRNPAFAPKNDRDVPSSGNNFFGYGSLEAAHQAGVFTGADYNGAVDLRPGADGTWSYDPSLDTSRLPTFEAGAEFSSPLTISAEQLAADPSYQFRRDEGMNALSSAQRARGMSLSGNALRDLTAYASNLASQEYGNVYNRAAADRTFRYGTALDAYNSRIGAQTNQLNRLAGAAGVGQQAVGNIGQAGQNYANAAGNILAQTGNSNANAALTQGAIGSNALAGFGNTLGNVFGDGGFNWLSQSPGWSSTSPFSGTGTGYAPVNWLS